MRRWPFALGASVLVVAWMGPLPALAQHLFSAHMTLHVAVIAIAAPLLAIGVAGGRFDPVRYLPGVFSPIPASIIELIVVWVWHAPALHHLARQSTAMLVLEQAGFLAVGLLVWLSAFGGGLMQQRRRTVAGVSGLLLTSMHMTLLGVLLALAGRVLYHHDAVVSVQVLPFALSPLEDQQLGGVLMLFIGGSAYLVGALALVSRLLKEKHDAVSPG